MDNRSKEARSKNMSHIPSKNTKPEETVRKYLFSQGFRYRKNVGSLPGKPDIVLPKYRTVVFVNGCFWHHHECRYFRWSKTNVDFWKSKIDNNVKRDELNINRLTDAGWKVYIVWECELKLQREATLSALTDFLMFENQSNPGGITNG